MNETVVRVVSESKEGVELEVFKVGMQRSYRIKRKYDNCDYCNKPIGDEMDTQVILNGKTNSKPKIELFCNRFCRFHYLVELYRKLEEGSTDVNKL